MVARARIEPLFRVLRGLPYVPNGAGQASDPNGTGVRAMTPNVGREGVEPPTPCASCKCSNQLS